MAVRVSSKLWRSFLYNKVKRADFGPSRHWSSAAEAPFVPQPKKIPHSSKKVFSFSISHTFIILCMFTPRWVRSLPFWSITPLNVFATGFLFSLFNSFFPPVSLFCFYPGYLGLRVTYLHVKFSYCEGVSHSDFFGDNLE